MNALEMKQVCKKYKINADRSVMALDNINITLVENEFVGIMGTSGSGKTTILNVASGIDKCDAGEICISGHNICEMTRNELSLFRRNHIGMIFQDFNLLSSLTVKENIMVPLILDKNVDKIENNEVNRLAQMLNIDSILDRYPYGISGGQQQRVAICRAIINDPKVVFADEPTGNLDSRASEKVLSYFDMIQKKYKVSILMVTHDPFSAQHCHRVIFLQDGSVMGEIRREGDKGGFMNKILEVLQKGSV
ncbi:ABC transporter ATP-binding protein [Paenibacillus sp. GCM10012306]